MTMCPRDGMVCSPAACCGAIEADLWLPDLDETIKRDAMLGRGGLSTLVRQLNHPYGWLSKRQDRRWEALEDRIRKEYGETADALGLGAWYPRTGIRTWQLERDIDGLIHLWRRVLPVLQTIRETREVLATHPNPEDTNYDRWYAHAALRLRVALQDLAVEEATAA